MTDGFQELSPELKERLKSEIITCSDTGCSKVMLKNYVQQSFPNLDKRAIYRTIKEMIASGELFYDNSGLLKSPIFYPNTAKTGKKRKPRNNI